MKTKIILSLILLLTVVSGCTFGKTDTAYFDMPCNMSCNSCDKEMCDNICQDSGIRVYRADRSNIFFHEGTFICRCGI